jgi:uncharacterized protein (TIGR02246 family)
MRLFSGYLIGALILLTVAQGSSAAAADAAAQDAVKTVIRNFTDAWNRHDMDAFANLFSEDADFVNVRGVRWIGRGAIKKAHAAAHATVFSKSRLSVVGEISVRFLKPDVAVARSIIEVSGQIDNSGGTLPPRDTLLTLVVVRQDAKWIIVVAQNTNIDTAVPPAKPEPAKP